VKGRKRTSAWIVLALSLVLALAACGGQATDTPSPAERFEQGNEYAQQGEFEQAIAEYEAVLEAEPDNVSAMTNLGVALYNVRRLDEAIAQYQKALEIAPNDADIHSNLGAAYVQKGQLQEALAEYQRAVDLQPDLAQAHFGLGVIYVELARNDEAIAAFESFLELDQGEDSMASDLARQYLQQLKGQ
jgi:Flp pilus assembly protein TadD